MKKYLSTAIMALLAAASCTPAEEPGQTSQAFKLTVNLSPYFGAGKTEIPVWGSEDKLVLTNLTSSESTTVKPALSGSSESMFSFKMDNAKDGDNMLAFRIAGNSEFKNGNLEFDIPVTQDGKGVAPVLATTYKLNTRKTAGERIALSGTYSVLLVNIVLEKYTVTKLELTSNGGENIAGRVAMDPVSGSFSASANKVTVELQNYAQTGTVVNVPVVLAPCHLSQGYHITFTTDKGTTFEYTNSDAVELAAGQVVESGKAAEDNVRKILVCGSNKVYLFNKELVNWGESYQKGLIWSWDCTSVERVFSGAKSSSHIDDTKIVNDKRQLLVTCSNNSGWCVLLEPDYSTPSDARLLFWTNSAPNAHSAEYLPGGYVVVACSTDGGDCIQLYDIKKNNSPIASYPLGSAHGAVWNPATERLYAIGGTTMQIYKWNPSVPALEKEREVSTSGYVSGLHDISLVDANTLIIGGAKCALFNISTNTFTQVAHFNPSGLNGIKSLNYNPDTGEIFYTFAVQGTSEGDYTWSSHKVRYTDNINGNDEKHILVNDINMYKCRVFTW